MVVAIRWPKALGDRHQEFPKPLTDQFVSHADVVITMSCGDAGPIYPASATKTGRWTIQPARASQQ